MPAPLVALDTIHEIRQACLCMAAQRAARLLARRFDRAFRPVGLTNQQFSLMMALNAPEPPTIGVLADLLGMDRTTLTAALKALERAGFIETTPNPKDRRARIVRPTEAGRAALAGAVPIWRAEHARLEAELSQPHAAALRAELGRVA